MVPKCVWNGIFLEPEMFKIILTISNIDPSSAG